MVFMLCCLEYGVLSNLGMDVVLPDQLLYSDTNDCYGTSSVIVSLTAGFLICNRLHAVWTTHLLHQAAIR